MKELQRGELMLSAVERLSTARGNTDAEDTFCDINGRGTQLQEHAHGVVTSLVLAIHAHPSVKALQLRPLVLTSTLRHKGLAGYSEKGSVA